MSGMVTNCSLHLSDSQTNSRGRMRFEFGHRIQHLAKRALLSNAVANVSVATFTNVCSVEANGVAAARGLRRGRGRGISAHCGSNDRGTRGAVQSAAAAAPGQQRRQTKADPGTGELQSYTGRLCVPSCGCISCCLA